MAPKQLLALRLLIENPKGLYGSEFVALSKGKLSRASIYTTLDRLVDEGFVREVVDPPEPKYLSPRTRHVITAAGQSAYNEFLSEQGLAMVKGAFQRA